MFYRNFTERYVLLEVMFYLRVCIVGRHILLLEMSYWGTCFTGGYILQDGMQEGMYLWKTCVSAGHVFYESMCYGRTCLAGLCQSNHLSCCEFWHLVFLFE